MLVHAAGTFMEPDTQVANCATVRWAAGVVASYRTAPVWLAWD